ncbi:MAG: protein BatD [Candidatus Marinimicrobia bacterium]|jgi:hypothetical protein|nr:protein BatD [Candidatus Neomarinimicrobiota bacterium]MBT3501420.1 protein BatD [Candidatus Neomarinimicrobiota bacterium]MBT3839441.1 protein BatD [Candidatus Neomarinimicrobiota bacterium]MBT3998574.1 protein BatD [Candidatus Neomarinimicrobiota bacterium]MBT4283046.1 protein BatD [Candidatus Neomarinimicrobiota bacterium]
MRLFGLTLILSISLSQTVQISVDRNRLEEGELITLSIEVSGSKDFAQVDMSQIKKDFEILSGPGQQTNIQWINGSMTSTKTLTWTISPKMNGALSIPGIYGTVDGKTFRGKPIQVHVKKNSESTDNSVFIVAEVDKEKAYLGEQITVSFKLYKNVNMSIEPFQVPEFSGFWVEDLYTPQRVQYRNVTLQGVKYQVANLGQKALFPIPSTQHIIPQLKVKAQIEMKKKNRRRDPFFDPFFDSFLTQTKTKVLNTEKIKINIIPFPDPKPFDFSGAVGSFTISAKTDRDTAKVNEGFTFTISMVGTGNLGLFSIPEIKFPDALEAFPPTDNFEKDTFRDDLTGTQTWEYILIPRRAGNLTIPRVQMSYFDPKSRQWQRTQTNPIEIPILPGDSDLTHASGLTKREVELLGEDIRFIHTKSVEFVGNNKEKSKVAIFIYLGSMLIFVSPFFITKITGHRLSTSEGRQIRGALKTGLRELKKSEDDLFEIASRAFYIYMKNKLTLPTHNLDPASVESHLNNRISKDSMVNVLDLLKACDAGKYAPGGVEREANILNEMASIIKQIDREIS